MGDLLRVAYFTNSIAMGGMEKHVFELAAAVAKLDFDVCAIVPGTPAVAPLVEWFRAVGVEVHAMDLSGAQPPDRLGAQWLQLWQLLRARRIDVFHQHRTGPYHGKWACLAARASGVPAVIATEHLPAFRLRGSSRFLNRAADRLLDRVVTVCESDRRRQLRETWRPAEKVVTIHNGIDLSRFEPDGGLYGRARVALGVGPGVPVLGVVARLAPVKGITHLLKALPALTAEWPGLVVLIAGEGSERGALEAESTALGVADHVRFLGQRTDVAEVLGGIDLLVLPSEVESFPLVVLEAMAMCRPVVACDVGGVSEAVIDGLTGFVVPARDPKALAVAIGRSLRDSNLARLGLAARARVEERFTLGAMAAKTAALYRAVLAQRPAGTMSAWSDAPPPETESCGRLETRTHA